MNKIAKDKLPPMLEGLTFITKQDSKSQIEAQDVWTDEDFICLKYVEDKRLACYIAMARDKSARPNELLDWRLNDIEIKRTQDGELYVPLDVVRRARRRAATTRVRIVAL
jgi:hypothetical protein